MRQDTLRQADILESVLPVDLNHAFVWDLLELSLLEDLTPPGKNSTLGTQLVGGDITSSATIDPGANLTGKISAKSDGIIAGLPVVEAIFKLVSPGLRFSALVEDGNAVASGQALAVVTGPGRALLVGERPGLNFLGRLSGIATLTRKFVDAVAGTKAVILDTRKTAPGLRYFDKYAVRQGGGKNHRRGLFDMALIKDNHIDGVGGIGTAVERVREQYGDQYPIEVEVKNLDELKIALSLNVDRIMLDNMNLAMMKDAVKLTAGQTPLEASGNVSLDTVQSIAETGVDYISVGALTHSVPVFDVSMRLSQSGPENFQGE